MELWKWMVGITTPLLVYQITVSVLVTCSLVNAIADWFTFRRPTPPHSIGSLSLAPPSPGEERAVWERGTGGEVLPSLSLLIPARNEETAIETCVRSLLNAEYSGTLEILVLDDRSEDRTGEIVERLAKEDNRVRLLHGGELLPGWKGKPNALRQLAEAATGELLLLTDADCVFYPGSLDAAVAHWKNTKADCLSLMPYFDCRTFWEHVILPLQIFLVFTTLPIRNVYASKNPAFAAANGAFILIPAATYRKIGGHTSVKGEMAEDIKFAQYIKRQGLKLVYGDGSYTYAVRMYDSLRGIWDGFSKNMFPAMGSSLAILGIWLLFQITTQILPGVFVIVALLRRDASVAGGYLPLFHLLVALGIRFALSLRFRQALWGTLTHSIGWCIVIAIAIHSAYLALSGKGHTWKGRLYPT